MEVIYSRAALHIIPRLGKANISRVNALQKRDTRRSRKCALVSLQPRENCLYISVYNITHKQAETDPRCSSHDVNERSYNVEEASPGVANERSFRTEGQLPIGDEDFA